MEWKEHTHLIGCIVTNWQALETVLRRFLVQHHGQDFQFPKVGDVSVKETWMTNYAALGDLIDEFHAALNDTESKFEIDFEVITLRDAIAHGRLVTDEEFPARLWKFAKPRNGDARIDFCEELTADWLKGKSDLIYREKEKVVACFKARGYQGLR